MDEKKENQQGNPSVERKPSPKSLMANQGEAQANHLIKRPLGKGPFLSSV